MATLFDVRTKQACVASQFLPSYVKGFLAATVTLRTGGADS
jgi:hypothetical protein